MAVLRCSPQPKPLGIEGLRFGRCLAPESPARSWTDLGAVVEPRPPCLWPEAKTESVAFRCVCVCVGVSRGPRGSDCDYLSVISDGSRESWVRCVQG